MAEELNGQMNISMMNILNTPKIDDVVGTARRFLDDFVLSIESEQLHYAMGVKPDKTFGLFGVPGTGKTMSIQALNNTLNECVYLEAEKTGKINTDKIQIMPFEYSVGKYGTAYINMGSKIMQNFFDRCGMYAQYGKKVLIVVDEADALISSRKNDIHQEDRKLLETFMTNMQILHDTPNMYAVLMTNLPEICDEASLRAGRLDKKYLFELPNYEERKKAFEKTRDSFNQKAGYQVVRGIKPEILATMSQGMNYADITSCVESTIRQRVIEIAKNRTHRVIPAGYINQKRLEDKVKEHMSTFHPQVKKIGF